MVGVDIDKEGLIPSKLESLLKDWPKEREKPRVLYTIPIGNFFDGKNCKVALGQNPSGATQTVERKREIYDIASKNNLIIIGNKK